MENIVRLDEIEECVARALKGINDGVNQARQQGLNAELPKEVQFTMVVVKDWQELEVQGGERGEQIEIQGGGSKETTNATSTEKQITDRVENQKDERKQTESQSRTEESTRTESGQQASNNAHNQDSKTTYTYEDV